MDRAKGVTVMVGLVASVLAWPAAAQEAEPYGSELVEAGEEVRQPVNPVGPTYPDDAYVLDPGVLQVETGYTVQLVDEPAPTLHVWDVYAALGVADLIEVRVGWDVLNAADGRLGMGDLRLGLKGGFLGGFDEQTALAGLFWLELPTARTPFGLGSGARFVSGLVATTEVGPVQLDLQATADLHLFADDPAFLLPLAVAGTWAPLEVLRVYADAVLGIDLEDFSRTRTSVLAGAGFRLLPTVEVNAAVRVGLATSVPNAVVQFGLSWQVGPLW